MIAIKEIVESKDNQIIIDLPETLSSFKTFEIIVLPSTIKKENTQDKNKFLALAGKIDLNEEAVNDLRRKSKL